VPHRLSREPASEVGTSSLSRPYYIGDTCRLVGRSKGWSRSWPSCCDGRQQVCILSVVDELHTLVIGTERLQMGRGGILHLC